MSELPHFLVGQHYSRQEDIHKKFGGSRQSGIAPSAQVPAIFLFTGASGPKFGYHDTADVVGADHCEYVGEGQVGDMVFTAGNKAVRDHVKDGRALHLFRAEGKSKPYLYLGEFALVGHSSQRGMDREKNDRSLIVFHLIRVPAAPVDEVLLQQSAGVDTIDMAGSIADARGKAIAACESDPGVEVRQAFKNYFVRSQAVRQYALMRSQGVCEACGEPSPFSDKLGQPYLEVHHTTRLSDGGVDHPCNVAALCPTCH